MHIDYKQARYLGIGLIILGVFAALKLWGLLLPIILGTAGGYMYMQRRQMGRIGEAVQGGLWLFGLALAFLIHFVFPGVLLLAGASLLIRGREPEVDQRVQSFLGQVKTRANTMRQPSAQNVPVHHPTPDPTLPTEDDDASTGKTIRL